MRTELDAAVGAKRGPDSVGRDAARGDHPRLDRREGDRQALRAADGRRRLYQPARAGMPLEADPTVIYPVTRGRPLGRRILRSELQADNGYNTYARAGLPIGPIANPGRESIAAVLNPEPTRGALFRRRRHAAATSSPDAAEHNANVAALVRAPPRARRDVGASRLRPAAAERSRRAAPRRPRPAPPSPCRLARLAWISIRSSIITPPSSPAMTTSPRCRGPGRHRLAELALLVEVARRGNAALAERELDQPGRVDAVMAAAAGQIGRADQPLATTAGSPSSSPTRRRWLSETQPIRSSGRRLPRGRAARAHRQAGEQRRPRSRPSAKTGTFASQTMWVGVDAARPARSPRHSRRDGRRRNSPTPSRRHIRARRSPRRAAARTPPRPRRRARATRRWRASRRRAAAPRHNGRR